MKSRTNALPENGSEATWGVSPAAAKPSRPAEDGSTSAAKASALEDNDLAGVVEPSKDGQDASTTAVKPFKVG